MPNHVENDLFISGEAERLKAFLAGLKRNEDGEFSILRSYYPMPDELSETTSPTRIITTEEKEKQTEANKDKPEDFKSYGITLEEQAALLEKYGVDNWYDWTNNNWGTKWGDYNAKITEGEDDDEPHRIAITFETAWSPPVQGMAAVAAQFPDLEFSLYSYEKGMQYQTGHEYEGGKLVETWRHKYQGNRGG